MADHKRRQPSVDVQQGQVKRQQLVREPTIFNIRPCDDIVHHIAQVLQSYCDLDNVEIEAKLGVFVNKRTGERLDIGALTETVLSLDNFNQYRFDSNMPLKQHRQFNELLNGRVSKSQGERITYKHTRETDRFYSIPNSGRKCRVTTDQQTNEIVPNGIIEKKRILDINIHAPRGPLDYRISINTETPLDNRPTTQPKFERSKDRVTYQHGGLRFDLTQVKSTEDRETNLGHELELEFMDTETLAAEKARYERREPSQYMSIVESFVNNIRLLCSHATEMKSEQ